MISPFRPGPTSSLRLTVAARIARHGLIAAEGQALFGGVPDDDGVAQVDRIDRIARAAFAQTALQVVAEASTFDTLIERVASAEFDADRFRIDVHDPSDRLGMDSADAARHLADVIAFGPDLRNPLHRFIVVATESSVAFGRVTGTTDALYRRHESKPWTTSSSLDPRFSRGLVNLVPHVSSILDPCCGAGSIVLEAASLGLGATGVDHKNAMAGMTRENMANYSYAGRVERADSRDLDDSFAADAIVTDLPYGHAIERDDTAMLEILRRCAHLAPLGVFVAQHDITDWLTSTGHRVDAVHTVVKRRGFTRHIHVTSC